jgi:tRNA dimethylallyltransferase
MLLKRKLVVLAGPTAAGKTEVSILLASRLNGEIVSADSRLFYRGMDVGTAKPTLAERRGIPHHLVDMVEPDETWSLGVFQQKTRVVIEEISMRGKLPFLVGGTGQYIRAVTHNWNPPAVSPDQNLRAALESWGNQIGALELHRRLAVLDPQAAKTIDHRNVRRTIRALEVIFSTGQRFSDQRLSGVPNYDLLMVGLTRPRTELYQRIDERIDRMISQGLVEEVRSLLARGFSPDLPAMSAIGYNQIAAYLLGEVTLEEAITEMRRKTRIFVRRQANWFKQDDANIHWFTMTPVVVDEIEALIRGWLHFVDA